MLFSRQLLAMLTLMLLVSACGKNNEPFADESNSERYSPDSYAPFVTTRPAGDLEGTWIAFVDGTITTRDFQLRSFKADFSKKIQFHSRAIYRIRRNIDTSDTYYINSCGPQIDFSNNDMIQFDPANNTVEIPFHTSPSYDRRYTMPLIDPNSIQALNQMGFDSSTGEGLSWNLSFTIRRISDDAFYPVAALRDNKTGDTSTTGCIFESDGDYAKIEPYSDHYSSGHYYSKRAYYPSTLTDSNTFYTREFSLTRYQGLYSTYREGFDNEYFGNSSDMKITRASNKTESITSIRIDRTNIDKTLTINP